MNDYYFYEQINYWSPEKDDILCLDDLLNKLKEARKIDVNAHIDWEGVCVSYRQRRTEESTRSIISGTIGQIIGRINLYLRELNENPIDAPLWTSAEDGIRLIGELIYKERDLNNTISSIKRHYQENKTKLENELKEKYWGPKPETFTYYSPMWPPMYSGCPITTTYFNELNDKDKELKEQYNITL